MIERQRANRDELTLDLARGHGGLQPGLGGEDGREQRAVREDRALGNAGRAAGILEDGDILALDGRRGKGLARAFGQRGPEGRVARQRPCRHHFAAHDKIDDGPLHGAQHVAHAGDDHVLDLRLGQGLLQDGGEILEHDDGQRAGILQLMLELARRVERVDVDGDEARANDGGERDRILQHVRQHDGDAVALLEAFGLQPGREEPRHAVDVAEGDGLVHADIGLVVRVLLVALLEQRRERLVAAHVDVARNARRIGVEPDLVHNILPAALRWPHMVQL